MHTTATLDGAQLVIAGHAGELPYGTVLRLGLDRVVVPHVVSGALDLADAFARSVRCEMLGAHIAEYLGVGTIDMYAHACEVALMSLAAEIYERLEAAPVQLVIEGSAHAADVDGDGPMDSITTGAWTGTFAGVPIAPSSFEGTAR